jgi:hypothetical protein
MLRGDNQRLLQELEIPPVCQRLLITTCKKTSLSRRRLESKVVLLARSGAPMCHGRNGEMIVVNSGETSLGCHVLLTPCTVSMVASSSTMVSG